MARLPNIDPTTRTLLVTGYPNVGKSSFMNKLTRADVEVQPYAFTTKSLFVGHTDYKYLRWQVIDTPGILDHPLEERNTIEMQSITALAHLRCCVLFFIDISEQCGYSISQQVSLFQSIRPLFTNKPLVLVLNKIDIKKPEDLSAEDKALIDGIVKDNPSAGTVQVIPMSTLTEENVTKVKELACEVLLQHRNEQKLSSNKNNLPFNTLHLALPQARDEKERPPVIPETLGSMEELSGAKERIAEIEKQSELYKEMDPEWTGFDWRKYYLLENYEWNFDKVPEIINGKNIADFITEDIEEKLAALEKEEAERLKELENQVDEEDTTIKLTDEEWDKVYKIREKKQLLMLHHKLLARKTRIGRQHDTQKTLTVDNLQQHLSSLGIETDKVIERAKSQERKRPRSVSASRVGRKRTREEREQEKLISMTPKPGEGFATAQDKMKSERLLKRARKYFNVEGRKGEADRTVPSTKPKHLFAGKRKLGKTERR
eukprot:TRINITY_DN34_c0_g1_i2.p1 TRINITY_DN34_c0_g1~~TRINITY_DN34_c0_g1_i2.p1  ORF type:complete len:571 (-),score=111.59 TRINITY_DN34_c0_g1_i2:146-1609(-)